MGPPGAGKGTQACLLADHYGIVAVSSGNLFRTNVSEQTPMGKKVSALIARGDFVPDVLTTSMVFKRLLENDCQSQGWLLDGYPRTVGQVMALDLAQAEMGTKLAAAVSLVAEPNELVDRMLRRAELEGRADDNEETIRHRINVYHTQTEALLTIYRDRGLLVEVDAIGEVEAVSQRLIAALDAKLSR